ncbi:kinase-like protein, partial [Peniophora sp. CONT]
TGLPVAIKIAREDKSARQEVEAYKRLNAAGCRGVPRLLHTRTDSGKTVMVLELLGLDLQSLIDKGGPLSIPSVVNVGIVMLYIPQSFHDAGLVHGDIKPGNVMLPHENGICPLYLIDLGAAQSYMSPDGSHLPEQRCGPPLGSIDYTSVRTENEFRPCRRDDIESLGYVLVYLAKAILPWTDCDDEDVQVIKEYISPETLCKGLPHAIMNILVHARALPFDGRPDYERLRSDLEKEKESPRSTAVLVSDDVVQSASNVTSRP